MSLVIYSTSDQSGSITTVRTAVGLNKLNKQNRIPKTERPARPALVLQPALVGELKFTIMSGPTDGLVMGDTGFLIAASTREFIDYTAFLLPPPSHTVLGPNGTK